MNQQQQFNKKYEQWLGFNSKGLTVPLSETAMRLLEEKFQLFIKLPAFIFNLIEYRMGEGYFKASGLTIDQIWEVEQILTNNKE